MPSVPILSLDPPIRVTHVDTYGQGAIWWFQFEDANGQQTTLSLDNRPESPTRFRLFEGSRFPNRPESVLLDLGGDEEAIAVPFISHWLDSDEFDRLREYGQELLLSAFNRYGEPRLPHDLTTDAT